jgi:hypothetical protein
VPKLTDSARRRKTGTVQTNFVPPVLSRDRANGFLSSQRNDAAL